MHIGSSLPASRIKAGRVNHPINHKPPIHITKATDLRVTDQAIQAA
jgi:hypothetical protein